MYVFTSDEMKNIDYLTIQNGIEESTLIEQAAGYITDLTLSLNPKRVLCLCGNGNNGADALAAARMLKNKKIPADIFLCSKKDNTSHGFQNQLSICKETECEFVEEILNDKYDIIIDGIFGIGFHGSLEKEYISLINLINKSGKTVISIDIPSGVDSNTGLVKDTAIMADYTITFGGLKIAHLLYPGKSYCGNIKIVELSFLNKYIEKAERFVITPEIAQKFLPVRNQNSHKYSFGKVLILAGSKDFPGAPILSALGCQRIGAGIVRLITPNKNESILPLEPSIIYNHFDKDYFDLLDFERVKEVYEKSDIILIGPGISKNSDDFVIKIIEELKPEQKLLIDADAIQPLKKVNKETKNIIVTPHSGEMERLYKNLCNNVFELEEFSALRKMTIVFKDSTTIITDGEKTFFNILGNSSLSKGGSGDLLSGIIAGLMAQGASPIEAAVTGTFILYYTANKLTETYTEYFITPKLISDNLYIGLKKLQP